MSEAPTDIISDAEIERVHGHANFCSMSKRGVVNEGVLKYAFGFSGGHTQLCILLEHGLIRKPPMGREIAPLTKRGQRYLRSVYGPSFLEIAAMGAPSLQSRKE